MSEIPDDIMQSATALFNEIRGMQGEPSSFKIEAIAGYLCDERQRHAEVMEEVRKVLGNIVTAVEREPVVSNLDYPHAHNDWRGWRKKIMRPAADEARALLSRLEER